MSHLSEEKFKEISNVFVDCHKAVSTALFPAIVTLTKDCKTINELTEKVNELFTEMNKLCENFKADYEMPLAFNAYLHVLTSILMDCNVTFSSKKDAEEQHAAQ